MTASIGAGASITATTLAPGTPQVFGAPGDVIVEAISRAEGDAKAQSYGGALLAAGGGAHTTTIVTPNVFALVGSGASVDAGGKFTLAATYEKSGSPPSANVLSVDGGLNTISVDPKLALRDGDVITYEAASGSPALIITAAAPSGTSLVAGGRLYGVLVYAAGQIQLGTTFTGADVDPLTDTIVFAGDHNLLEGDFVYARTISGDATGLSTATRYVVRVVDSHTIKLATGTEAAAKTFNPATAVSGNTIMFISPHGFSQNQPVTYNAPNAAKQFGSLLVDVEETFGQWSAEAGHRQRRDQGRARREQHLPRVLHQGRHLHLLRRPRVLHRRARALRRTDRSCDRRPHRQRRVLRLEGHGLPGAARDRVGAGFEPRLRAERDRRHDHAPERLLDRAGLRARPDDHGQRRDRRRQQPELHDLDHLDQWDGDQGRRARRRHERDRLELGARDDRSARADAVEPSNPANDTAHTLTRLTELPIAGLVDGQTYYVQLDAADPTHKFRLASAIDGATITLGVSGLNATHTIGTRGSTSARRRPSPRRRRSRRASSRS